MTKKGPECNGVVHPAGEDGRDLPDAVHIRDIGELYDHDGHAARDH